MSVSESNSSKKFLVVSCDADEVKASEYFVPSPKPDISNLTRIHHVRSASFHSCGSSSSSSIMSSSPSDRGIVISPRKLLRDKMRGELSALSIDASDEREYFGEIILSSSPGAPVSSKKVQNK